MMAQYSLAIFVCLLLLVPASQSSGQQEVLTHKHNSDSLLMHLMVTQYANIRNELKEQQEKHASEITSIKNELIKQQEKHALDITNIKNDLKNKLIKHAGDIANIKNELIKQQEKHAEEMKELKGILKSRQPAIGFHVALTKIQSTGGKIAFDRILQNSGNGWNSITHTYTVPTKGLYFFCLNIMNYGPTHAHADLMRGSTHLQTAWVGPGDRHNVGTTSAVLEMKAGEHVYARYRAGPIYSSGSLLTHLVGFLIQKTY